MQERRNPIWTILGFAVAVLVLLAVMLGPRLYRAGRGVVSPLIDVIGVEKRVAELDAALQWKPPADPVVDPERLAVFLEVRREIEPSLAAWTELVEEVRRSGEESLDTAARVLAATRDTMHDQLAVLERHRMAPAEFRWLDDLVYGTWYRQVGDAAARAADERLREATREDLRFLAEDVVPRHGRGAAVVRLEERLRQRLEELERPPQPVVEGVPPAARALLWAEREAIAAASLEAYEAPLIIRQGETIDVKIDKRREGLEIETGRRVD